jgi:beta-phosphoglucomutase-like phosphatase (HAD superfamily)
MKKISMIVFDMAGTTIDEDNIVYKTLHKAIAESGVVLSLDEVLSIGAGKEKLNAIKDILAVFGNAVQQAQADEIFTHFLADLEDVYNQNDIKPTENAEEVLKALHLNKILK